jgi:endonuclease/exonuclease/phosphatase family metal-dependent hydrolase
MKLIQINALMGRVAPKLVDFIKSEQPDIICMQEVFNSPTDVPLPNNQFNIGSAVKAASGLEYEFFAMTESVDVAGHEVPFGNAIYSRYPILGHETCACGRVVRHIDNDNSPGLGEHQPRNAQIVKLDIDGQNLIVVNYHGYLARGTGERFGDRFSEENMQKVADGLRKFADQPIILVGDLNVISESQTMRVFDGWLDDLTAKNHTKTTLSPIHRYNEPVSCDHILVNEQIRVDNFGVKDVVVSDHLPLVMEFEIQ